MEDGSRVRPRDRVPPMTLPPSGGGLVVTAHCGPREARPLGPDHGELRDVLAKHIITMAQGGERDSTRLRDGAIAVATALHN
jgi:hypothetical protein